MGVTKTDRIGITNTNNFGSLMSVYNYRGSNDIDIIFPENNCIVHNKKYLDFMKGKISSPYETRAFGVGYLGEGKHKTRENGKKTNKYTSWHGILVRCCSEAFQKTRPTYINCVVTKEWLNFQNFGDWYDKNYYKVENKIMCLDKDILIKGNKIYSPNTCVFTPISINSLFVKCNTRRGKFPIGVSYHKRDCSYEASCIINDKPIHLGTFNNPIKAFNSYKEAKEKYIKEIADRYKNNIPLNLYEAMYKYKVEITD